MRERPSRSWESPVLVLVSLGRVCFVVGREGVDSGKTHQTNGLASRCSSPWSRAWLIGSLATCTLLIAVTGLVHLIVINTGRPRNVERRLLLGNISKAKFRPVMFPLGVGSGIINSTINDHDLRNVTGNVVTVWRAGGISRVVRANHEGGVFSNWK